MIRRLLLYGLPTIFLAVIGLYFLATSHVVSTENAYVKANLVAISAEVGGPIVDVQVDDNSAVAAGDVLFRIDPRPYEIAVAQAAARLDMKRDEIEALKASYREKTGELDLARTNLTFAEREYERQSTLAVNGHASRSQLDEVETSLAAARQSMVVLAEERAQILSRLSGDPDIEVTDHPGYLDVRGVYDAAALDLEWTIVRAPFSGVVGRMPEVGQHVEPGQSVLTIFGTNELWIEANFRETDLANVVPGQPVEIRVDTYDGYEWRGWVESIAYSTGAEVAILPAQNATGNWIKIVQRIPVRIRIALNDDAPILRAGMSARVEIDTQAALHSAHQKMRTETFRWQMYLQ